MCIRDRSNYTVKYVDLDNNDKVNRGDYIIVNGFSHDTTYFVIIVDGKSGDALYEYEFRKF